MAILECLRGDRGPPAVLRSARWRTGLCSMSSSSTSDSEEGAGRRSLGCSLSFGYGVLSIRCPVGELRFDTSTVVSSTVTRPLRKSMRRGRSAMSSPHLIPVSIAVSARRRRSSTMLYQKPELVGSQGPRPLRHDLRYPSGVLARIDQDQLIDDCALEDRVDIVWCFRIDRGERSASDALVTHDCTVGRILAIGEAPKNEKWRSRFDRLQSSGGEPERCGS